MRFISLIFKRKHLASTFQITKRKGSFTVCPEQNPCFMGDNVSPKHLNHFPYNFACFPFPCSYAYVSHDDIPGATMPPSVRWHVSIRVPWTSLKGNASQEKAYLIKYRLCEYWGILLSHFPFRVGFALTFNRFSLLYSQNQVKPAVKTIFQ